VIIDFETDSWTAALYDIFDARTGDNINHLHIYYADDETGVIRRHLMDSDGNFLRVGDGRVATQEERRPIRIVRKPGVPSDIIS
jgi:hypothetical protein